MSENVTSERQSIMRSKNSEMYVFKFYVRLCLCVREQKYHKGTARSILLQDRRCCVTRKTAITEDKQITIKKRKEYHIS